MAVIALVPHTRIDNSIIDELTPKIGLAGLGVLALIKRYVNTKTGQCNPSYKTLARKAGVDRSTIIRYVKKLRAFNLIDPELRFKEDGSPTSNQYNFPYPPSSGAPPVNRHESDKQDKGGATMPPPQGQECHPPGGTTDPTPGASLPPEQSSLLNKKQRTIADVDFMDVGKPFASDINVTPRQKACLHPATEIVFLADNITICNHCYGLLDENFKLKEEKTAPEIVEAA
jgi:Helix-turn-helix domain